MTMLEIVTNSVRDEIYSDIKAAKTAALNTIDRTMGELARLRDIVNNEGNGKQNQSSLTECASACGHATPQYLHNCLTSLTDAARAFQAAEAKMRTTQRLLDATEDDAKKGNQ